MKPVKPEHYEAAFSEVLHFIESARQRAHKAVNTNLIDLYWQIGEYISRRITEDGWGKRTVTALADFIGRHHPGQRGFSPQNLWRMRQFFEAYQEMTELSSLLRELPWSSNLHILTKTKRPEEREFYLRMATRNGWQVREVARQIDRALFERAVLNPPKLSTVLRELHPTAGEVFKDAYFFEFLSLPVPHSESDLHNGLVRNLGRFINELGRDFCFVGSEYPLQVGGKDFALDLLFFHRGLNCLVAIELKVGEFQPEHLGKLEFYLEALDRDVRKPHEHPAIGVLLCATKDSEVVEYALSRSLSPALIAEYQTKLPDKKLLQDKLREFYELLSRPDELKSSLPTVEEIEAELGGDLVCVVMGRTFNKSNE
jgi:predicted nuclease of restriction endonuclease-like (RecB) superfamily